MKTMKVAGKIIWTCSKLILGASILGWSIVSSIKNALEIVDYATDKEYKDRLDSVGKKEEPKQSCVVLTEEDYARFRNPIRRAQDLFD